MSEGLQLVLWIAGVHLIGFICIAVLLLPSLRDDGGTDSRADEGEDGWGRGPRTPPVKPGPPRGGIPLPDAVPAAIRLRGPGRISDGRIGRQRRPTREPARSPVRRPHRVR